MIENNRGISASAAKYVYKQISGTSLSPIDIVENNNLWIVDEWTHVGYCIMICIDNQKMIDSYKKGNTKMLDTLTGKVIQLANMTCDARLIKELMPDIIATHF